MMLEEENRKRKLITQRKENEFSESTENQMNLQQITIKLSDQQELIKELYETIDTREQEFLDLKMVMKCFQSELEKRHEELKELKD